MDLAIVIPAFNDAEAIPDAIRSALSQVGVSEVLIVDDGSDDDLDAAVNSVGDERVRLIRQPNGGPGAARNSGAEAATATHVVFLDADDRFSPGAGELLLNAAAAPGVELVRSGAVLVGGQLAGGDGHERVWLAEPSPWNYPRGCPLPGTFLVARDAFQAVGGYDPEFRYGENSELLLRLTSAAGNDPDRIAFVPHPTIRKIDRGGRPSDFYVERRTAAIERMLDVHRRELDIDRASLANHHAILATLQSARGRRTTAVRHAARSAVARPGMAGRDWARVLLLLVKPRSR